MKVNFNGYDESVLTFIADNTLTKAGQLVKIVDDGTVGRCEVGDTFCGVCVAIRDGYAAVQLSGYVVVQSKNKVQLGYQNLVAGEDGSVIARPHGRDYLVVHSVNGEVGFIL